MPIHTSPVRSTKSAAADLGIRAWCRGYGTGVGESPKERTDRQLEELLEELRVVMPGAQVLLGFMLAVPFQSRFAKTTGFERGVLYTTVVLTAAGALTLMAPSVYHRVRWEEGGKEDVVRVGHKLFLLGTLLLALGMSSATFLVGFWLLGIAGGAAVIAVTLGVVSVTWYALPLTRGRSPAVREEP